MVRLDEHVFVLPEELYQYILARPEEDDRDVNDQDTIRRICNGVCRAVESHLHRPVVIQALTHVDDGGDDTIVLPYRPLVVDDDHDLVVVEGGVTLTQGSDYLTYASKGFIVRASGEWYQYPQGTTVTYHAGYALQERDDDDELANVTGCPEDIRLAALEWGRVTWRGGPAIYTSQDDNEVSTSPAEMPGNVRGWLKPYRILRPGVA